MSFNPSRLEIARKRRMLNKKELAEAIGAEPHTVIRWENGDIDRPTPENLEALARVLQFPKEFFSGGCIDQPQRHSTSFRSQTAMLASERDAALAAGAIGYLVCDWVTSRFNLPAQQLFDLRDYPPEEAAQTLRQQWTLGEKPVVNMIQLLESKGVKVFSLAENTRHVNAYSTWRKHVPFVFLNTLKTAECSRFDAAHELAHLVLHQDGKTKGREAEDQAHQFASAFLMPKADILAMLPRVASMEQLIKAKHRWKVSLAALCYRLHKLGILSDWRYRDFCIEMAKRGYNTREPMTIPRERSIVWEKVIKSLWAEKSTHLQISQELFLPPAEVEDLLFGILSSLPEERTEPRSAIKVLGSFEFDPGPNEKDAEGSPANFLTDIKEG